MPAPIMPAPITPTRVLEKRAGTGGRLLPALTSFIWKKKVPIMFLATCPVASLVR